jgi:hypothetical protein
MKKLIFALLLISINSCSTYIDVGNNVNSDKLDFIYLKEYNEFIYKSKINTAADSETYVTTNFSISLPKEIIKWKIRDNKFYFEYDKKQIIYIDSGYKNIGNANNWIIRDANKEDIQAFLKEYQNVSKHTMKIKENRISKVYSDGKTSILLFNIEQNKIKSYLDLIQKFRYIN